MSDFKQDIMNDLQDTFLNTDDFGIEVVLVRDNIRYLMKALFDEPSLDGAAIGAEVQAISHRPRQGDELNVIGKTSSVFTIDEGFTANKATFTGAPVKGDSFDIIYPGSFAAPAAMESMTFAEQAQKDASAKDHLQYFALLQGVTSLESFEFSQAWAMFYQQFFTSHNRHL